jgi:hypothetical protein
MRTLLLLAALGLTACGGADETDPDPDTSAGTDADTSEGTDADTSADTDTDTVGTSACQTCQQSYGAALGSCMNPCVNGATFCDQQMCRYACDRDELNPYIACLDAHAECEADEARARCQLGCRETWTTCVSGSVCPAGLSGNCETALIDCINTCG